MIFACVLQVWSNYPTPALGLGTGYLHVFCKSGATTQPQRWGRVIEFAGIEQVWSNYPTRRVVDICLCLAGLEQLSDRSAGVWYWISARILQVWKITQPQHRGRVMILLSSIIRLVDAPLGYNCSLLMLLLAVIATCGCFSGLELQLFGSPLGYNCHLLILLWARIATYLYSSRP